MTSERKIDPEIARLLENNPLELGDLSEETLPRYRAFTAEQPVPELSPDVEREDHEVPGDAENPAVMVRVHRPKQRDGLLPCLYWMHGGGLILGSNEMDDPRFDGLCQKFGMAGVSVQYRLAPETPYPGPIEDCYRGLVWLHENAGKLGIDASRIGIGGASAGGGLAASLALLARDRGEVPASYQFLIYPMIDDRQITPSSQWEVPIWPPTANHFGWTAYLGEAKGGANVSPYAAAARATDLSGLPPAFIMVGAADGFLDEDVDYATRLLRAGVPTELHVYPDAPHGFDMFGAGSTLSRRSIRDCNEWLEQRIAK